MEAMDPAEMIFGYRSFADQMKVPFRDINEELQVAGEVRTGKELQKKVNAPLAPEFISMPQLSIDAKQHADLEDCKLMAGIILQKNEFWPQVPAARPSNQDYQNY